MKPRRHALVDSSSFSSWTTWLIESTGPSSNSAFASHINDVVQAFHAHPTESNSPKDDGDSPSLPSQDQQRVDSSVNNANAFMLPKKEKIIEFVDQFFAGFGAMFPYLYKKSILDGLKDLESSSFKGARRPWLCLVNTIMAFATTSDVHNLPGHDRTPAERFLQRALKWLPDVSLRCANLECGKDNMQEV